jgi:hypothetical protein
MASVAADVLNDVTMALNVHEAPVVPLALLGTE